VVENSDITGITDFDYNFTVTVTPVADGAVITPAVGTTGSGDQHVLFNLEAALVEQGEYDNTPAADGPSDELYQLEVSGLNSNVTFFSKDGSGNFTEIADEDGSADTYLMSELTQDQMDHLYIFSEDSVTGVFDLAVSVKTQEVDGGVVVNTSTDAATDDISIKISNVADGNNSLTGDAGVNNLYGHLGNDTLDGQGGADFLAGGAGDDTITTDGLDYVSGGIGTDTLILTSGTNLDFDAIAADASKTIKGINEIDLGINGNHTLDNLSINDLLEITDSDNVLTIHGDALDTVNLENGDGGTWTPNGDNGAGYDVYIMAGGGNEDVLTVNVEDTITLNIIG
jgi:Ca2+-binding RTX toxin-like protein